MTRSFRQSKDVPHHAMMRSTGATKSDPTHVKKNGAGSKGTWGNSRDEIADGLEALENGDMPTRPPQQDMSIRKLSFSSSTSSNESNKDGPNSPVERITEEDTPLTEEPATSASISKKNDAVA